MKLNNHLIGQLEILEDEIIFFPNGIIGFENLKKFAVVNNVNFKPFCWLISMDKNNLAIPVVNPFLLIKEYHKKFPTELMKELKESDTNYEVLCVVTLTGDDGSITLNLKGPILIDYLRREGKQVVLNADILSVNYPLN